MSKRILARLLAGAAMLVATGTAGIAVAAPFDATNPQNWGVSVRNTIGSPVAELRDGMSSRLTPGGVLTKPPYGAGSLGIEVNSLAVSPTIIPQTGTTGPAEKADYGNEVDFFGDPIAALTQVGFHVFQTGENISAARGGPTNMPNIRFEIDPPGAFTYSTMVWVPDPVPATSINRWSGYLDATTTGLWYFTGAFGAAPPCNQASPCPFAAAKARAGAATIYSVLIGKGRDNMWIGAVDGLRLNKSIYDFERYGVRTLGSCRSKSHDGC